jgi:hypothetical protein
MSEVERNMKPLNVSDVLLAEAVSRTGAHSVRHCQLARYLSTCGAWLVLFGSIASPAAGRFQAEQVTPKPEGQQSSSTAKTDVPRSNDRGDTSKSAKSLDELLGVPNAPSASEGQSSDSAIDAAEREQAKRLQRSLDEASLQDLVQKALEGMRSASSRLTDQSDAGLGTQRIQEDVVKSLERLLEEAQKQQKKQQGSRSSSSSASRSQQQRKSGESQDPSERNGQQRQPERSRAQGQQKSSSSASGDVEAEVGTRDTDEAAVGGELSESRVEWGQLPERVRELVLQGRRDRVSTIYERLTREYYRRLAEEASK